MWSNISMPRGREKLVSCWPCVTCTGLLNSLLLGWIGFTIFLFAVSKRTLGAQVQKLLYKCWLSLKGTLFIWKEGVVGKKRTFENNLLKKKKKVSPECVLKQFCIFFYLYQSVLGQCKDFSWTGFWHYRLRWSRASLKNRLINELECF